MAKGTMAKGTLLIMLRLAVLSDERIHRDLKAKRRGKRRRRGRPASPWGTNSSTTEHSEKHGNNQDLENPSFDLRVGVAAEVDQQSRFHSGCLQVVQYRGLVLGRDRLHVLSLPISRSTSKMAPRMAYDSSASSNSSISVSFRAFSGSRICPSRLRPADDGNGDITDYAAPGGSHRRGDSSRSQGEAKRKTTASGAVCMSLGNEFFNHGTLGRARKQSRLRESFVRSPRWGSCRS